MEADMQRKRGGVERHQSCFSTLPAKTKPSLSLSNGRDALSGSSLNLIMVSPAIVNHHIITQHPSSAVTRSKHQQRHRTDKRTIDQSTHSSGMSGKHPVKQLYHWRQTNLLISEVTRYCNDTANNVRGIRPAGFTLIDCSTWDRS